MFDIVTGYRHDNLQSHCHTRIVLYQQYTVILPTFTITYGRTHPDLLSNINPILHGGGGEQKYLRASLLNFQALNQTFVLAVEPKSYRANLLEANPPFMSTWL